MSHQATDRPALPTGVVTFLLTDVETSTRLWREAPNAAALMARHGDLIAEAVARHRGLRPLEQGEGDSIVAAFERPSDAVAAALDAQRALHAEPWPDGVPVRVRMAIHTGEAELLDDHTYGGEAIIRCARIRGLGRGGHVLVSSATAILVADRLPPGASLAELPACNLDGFERPERIHALRHPEIDSPESPLRAPPARSLPRWPTSLVGRVVERRDVAALAAGSRVVTITGAGGSGKTRLAHAVAEDLAGHWRDGVVWVELARLSSGAQLAGTVAAACGLAEVLGASAEDVVLQHLARSERLLILDNCEHLLADCAALVDGIVRATDAVAVLATSREPLGIAGEVTWRIPSLGIPEAAAHDAAGAAACDSVRLFTERARAARPDFVLDGTTLPVVARICRRLDGIPLALELAAARLRSSPLERIADGLDDRFRVLTGGARTAMARQRTLLASVDWSHDLLDEQESNGRCRRATARRSRSSTRSGCTGSTGRATRRRARSPGRSSPDSRRAGTSGSRRSPPWPSRWSTRATSTGLRPPGAPSTRAAPASRPASPDGSSWRCPWGRRSPASARGPRGCDAPPRPGVPREAGHSSSTPWCTSRSPSSHRGTR